MTDQTFREIQLSGKQLVFAFMASVVVLVAAFLLGVSVGRGVRQSVPPGTDVVANDPPAGVDVDDGPQHAAQDDLADRAGDAAARPGQVRPAGTPLHTIFPGFRLAPGSTPVKRASSIATPGAEMSSSSQRACSVPTAW